MSVIQQKDLGILSAVGFAHMATLGPKHEPHSQPVWYDWDGTYVLVSQTKSRQKYRNVQRDPRVALSILNPSNPYHYVEVRGTVVRIEDDANNQFINSLAKKYMGVDTYPWHRPGDERVILYVQPEHTTSMGE